MTEITAFVNSLLHRSQHQRGDHPLFIFAGNVGYQLLKVVAGWYQIIVFTQLKAIAIDKGAEGLQLFGMGVQDDYGI